MKRSGRNKPTDGYAYLPQDSKSPGPITDYKTTFEELKILAEIVRNPRCPKDSIYRLFEEPQSQQTQTYVDSVLEKFCKLGIIRPLDSHSGVVTFTPNGDAWAREKFADLQDNIPPSSRGKARGTVVTPILRG